MASRTWFVWAVALGLLAVPTGSRADEGAAGRDLLQKRARILHELADGTGVPPEEIVTPGFPSGPGCTLGQRLQDMLKNGTITQAQYDTILARAAGMPQENVQTMKGMFDQGQGAALAKLLAGPGPEETDPSGKAPPAEGTEGASPTDEIPANVLRTLMSGPVDTLGQRAQDMLNNGTITQGQYDKINARLLSLPEGKLQAVKAGYDEGRAPGMGQAATDLGHRKARAAGAGTEDPSGQVPPSETSDPAEGRRQPPPSSRR